MRYLKSKYHIILLGGIAILLIAILLQFIPELPTQAKRADYNFSSKELLFELQNNQNQELNNYIEKTIKIEGIIKKISFKNNTYSLLLDGGLSSTFVLCEMQTDQNHHMPNLVQGASVQVKGIYKGYLMDAILLNCVLIENNKDE